MRPAWSGRSRALFSTSVFGGLVVMSLYQLSELAWGSRSEQDVGGEGDRCGIYIPIIQGWAGYGLRWVS
jgi:hypothetical protein